MTKVKILSLKIDKDDSMIYAKGIRYPARITMDISGELDDPDNELPIPYNPFEMEKYDVLDTERKLLLRGVFVIGVSVQSSKKMFRADYYHDYKEELCNFISKIQAIVD